MNLRESVRSFIPVFRTAARQWYQDNTFQQGAALAYYSVFSVAPILVIALAIAGTIFGEEAARRELENHLRTVVGGPVAHSLQEALHYAHTEGRGWFATLFGMLALALGAIGLFTQLQTSLDTIWEVKPKAGGGLWGLVRDRLLSFVLVLAVGALLLLSLAASTALHVVGEFVHLSSWPGQEGIVQAVHWTVSLVLLAILFALIYRVLPDVKLTWGDVWVGGIVTAALFALGNYLIGLYLARSSVASAYGAAGSLVIILLWVYYSSQVVLFGAEFTQAYAHYSGKQPPPQENAEPLQPEERLRQGLGEREPPETAHSPGV